jgi:hypothetical protein
MFIKYPNIIDAEIERLREVIGNIKFEGENGIPQFDRDRGITKEQALEMLNNQLNYFLKRKDGNTT